MSASSTRIFAAKDMRRSRSALRAWSLRSRASKALVTPYERAVTIEPPEDRAQSYPVRDLSQEEHTGPVLGAVAPQGLQDQVFGG